MALSFSHCVCGLSLFLTLSQVWCMEHIKCGEKFGQVMAFQKCTRNDCQSQQCFGQCSIQNFHSKTDITQNQNAKTLCQFHCHQLSHPFLSAVLVAENTTTDLLPLTQVLRFFVVTVVGKCTAPTVPNLHLTEICFEKCQLQNVF